MFYRRPIISVNREKDVVGVFWSPAFEVGAGGVSDAASATTTVDDRTAPVT